MEDTYLWLKLIHIVGVMFFMGNIIITGWWKNMADATKNPQIIAFAQRQVTLTDYIFTFGGILILAIAGFANAYLHEMSYSISWLKYGIIYFLLSGAVWLFILIPVQAKQAKMARLFAVSNEIPDQYWRLCTIWNLFGLLAIFLLLATVYFMVMKPV
jgi:uncharacterized membrane protein